jgi:phage shock protein PspC (stress-responsive transcriptional regulator)
MSEQKTLTRSSEERVLGGVCGGLAEYMNVDPVLVRLAFIALGLVYGFGALIYLVMWIVVPDEGGKQLLNEEVVRANLEDMGNQVRRLGNSSTAPALIGIVLVGVGALALARNLIPGFQCSFGLPLLLILVGGYLLLRRR